MSEDSGIVRQFRDHRITFTATSVVKEATGTSYVARLNDEREWYRFVQGHGFKAIPRVIHWDPFELERVGGVPLHHLTDSTPSARRQIAGEMVRTLATLHALDGRSANSEDARAVYEAGPVAAAGAIAKSLGSGWPAPRSVNGRRVHDLGFPDLPSRIRSVTERIRPPERFVPIHGDPVFANVLWDRSHQQLLLLSPRGRFGASAVFGDPLLDWACIYFASVENCDALLEGAFHLDRDANEAHVRVGSAGWEDTAGVLRTALPESWPDILRLQPMLWLVLAASLRQRPSQQEAAYLRALELLSMAGAE